MKECSHASVFFFKCSASCGTGAQRREVKCLNSEQTAAHDCRQEERPIIRHACNDRACNEGPFSLHRNPFRLISLLEILPLPQSWKTISIICWRSVWLTSWFMLLCVGFDIQSPMNLRGRCRTRRISPNRRTTKRTTEPRVTTTSMMSPRHLAVMNLTWWNILLVRYPPSKLKTLTLPLILLSTVVIIFFCWYIYRWKVRGQFQKLPLGTAGEIVQTEVLFGVVLRFMFQVENVRWRNGNTFQLCQPPNKMNIFLNFQDSANK